MQETAPIPTYKVKPKWMYNIALQMKFVILHSMVGFVLKKIKKFFFLWGIVIAHCGCQPVTEI